MSDPAYPDRRHVLDPDCARCPALSECRTRIAWGNGPLDADVAVVGEAPAAGDPDADRWRGGNLTGDAYTSRHSGRRVRRLFDDVGYADRVYYTNAVKCFPRDADADGATNREPTETELATCRAHLETELDRIDPAVVCPTGKHATVSVFELGGDELDGFLDAVLSPRDPGIGISVLPLLHPSYQDVWRARLGYTDEGYRSAVREALDALV